MFQRAFSEKPYEFVLTILVVFAAVMAAFTGYSSGIAGEDETDFRSAGLRDLNQANTEALRANQIILLDQRTLLEADAADNSGDPEFAQELRSRTRIVRLGYLDIYGNATIKTVFEFSSVYEITLDFGGDAARRSAIDAYIRDMYAPQRASQAASDLAFANANIVSTIEVNFLLATILFALGAVLASQGLAADSQRVRRLFMYIVLGFLVIPILLVVTTVFA